ncbi:Protein SAAL1, partial [Lamprotornis superbus]
EKGVLGKPSALGQQLGTAGGVVGSQRCSKTAHLSHCLPAPCQAWPGTMRLWICIALLCTVLCASAERPAIVQGIIRAGQFVRDAVGGAKDMYRAYKDMREANYKGADKYFHARGNYDAARRGPGGAWAARRRPGELAERRERQRRRGHSGGPGGERVGPEWRGPEPLPAQGAAQEARSRYDRGANPARSRRDPGAAAAAGGQGALWGRGRRSGRAAASLLRTAVGATMDRNPSPPCSDAEEEEGDAVGNTVYSKHWLFSVLTRLIEVRGRREGAGGGPVVGRRRVGAVRPLPGPGGDTAGTHRGKIRGHSGDAPGRFPRPAVSQVIAPAEPDPTASPEGARAELDEEMENDICKVWDMSMDEDVALFLQEFNAPDIFMGIFAKSKCPRLTEICVGILGNMACFQDICMSISKDENLGFPIPLSLFWTYTCTAKRSELASHLLNGEFLPRLLLTCLSQPEVANVWVERIRENPSVYDCVCFIMSSSTNVDLLVKVGEVVDKLFDLDEELMLNWIKNGTCGSVGPSGDDSPEELPDFKIVPCILEAAKQVRSDNPEGLDVYMHILQLLTTVDEGIQAIGKNLELLRVRGPGEAVTSGSPHIYWGEQEFMLLMEEKRLGVCFMTSFARSFASQMIHPSLCRSRRLCWPLFCLCCLPYMPLIGSLIRILQYMEGCGKRAVENSKESEQEETGRTDVNEEDFHLKILKDICCELLSNMLQELTKENTLEGLHQGHLNEQTCSCAFQNLLPLYFASVESFLEVLREADQTLADNLEKRFPSLKEAAITMAEWKKEHWWTEKSGKIAFLDTRAGGRGQHPAVCLCTCPSEPTLRSSPALSDEQKDQNQSFLAALSVTLTNRSGVKPQDGSFENNPSATPQLSAFALEELSILQCHLGGRFISCPQLSILHLVPGARAISTKQLLSLPSLARAGQSCELAQTAVKAAVDNLIFQQKINIRTEHSQPAFPWFLPHQFNKIILGLYLSPNQLPQSVGKYKTCAMSGKMYQKCTAVFSEELNTSAHCVPL